MNRPLLACALSLLVVALPAQDYGFAPSSETAFQAGIVLGSDVLPGPGGAPESWTRLGFTPDISIGKFGVGLDLTLRFQLYPSEDRPIRIYEGDWIPTADRTLLDIYLPKILYFRYGLRGVDPFHVKLGSIKDFTLGNGFIAGGYSNMRFLPATRLFGIQLGVDGALFGFPFAGIELITGNLARFDVVGGRFYVRPLAGSGLPLLSSLQVGATGVFDRDPYLYSGDPSTPDTPYPPSESVAIFGADITLPVLASPLLSMTAYVEGALQPSGATGAATGIGGRILGMFIYDAQIRSLQEGFVPVYFDANYDLYRASRFRALKNTIPGPHRTGWLAGAGTSLFKDKLILIVSVDGPFAPIPASRTERQGDYPHGKAILELREGVLPGIFFDLSYEKYFIGRKKPFFADLVDPTDAVIGLAANYRIGSSVLTLRYDASWDPIAGKFNVRSSLVTTVRF